LSVRCARITVSHVATACRPVQGVQQTHFRATRSARPLHSAVRAHASSIIGTTQKFHQKCTGSAARRLYCSASLVVHRPSTAPRENTSDAAALSPQLLKSVPPPRGLSLALDTPHFFRPHRPTSHRRPHHPRLTCIPFEAQRERNLFFVIPAFDTCFGWQ
jgi:hypothetical protein